jgi:hypothetical protein
VAKAIFFSPHAMQQMQERQVDEIDVLRAIEDPDQTVHSRGRTVFHELTSYAADEYLLRVFCDEADDAYVVVTVYPTSKISKYWRQA